MATRTPTRRKKNSKKRGRKSSAKSPLLRAFGGLAILLLLVALAGVAAHYFINPAKPQRPAAPAKLPPAAKAPAVKAPAAEAPAAKEPVVKEPVAEIPTFEIYPQKDIPAEKQSAKPQPPDEKKLPRVAIIIDDLGYDRKLAKKLADLNAVLTFSILPYGPYKDSIADMLNDRGLEIMLHLPMEPMEYPAVNPGPGTLLTSMTPDQLISQLKENLNAVPYIKGVNNHMGSKMTAESGQMYQIFSVLKERNLFFIDSRTTPRTLCKPSARLFQILFAQRDVFLDHLQDADFIRRQVKELVRIARRNGYAVGIGHPHLITYTILREMLPELQTQVQLVPASEIVHHVG
jgi:polysaccharide deacetylase 2 family uncharacterized protein YibQ